MASNSGDTTSATNSLAPSSFLRLQPELRLLVYEQLLSFPVGLKKLPLASSNNQPADLSIIFLNKLIHKEAIKVFYSNNKFTLRHSQIHLDWPCTTPCSCGYEFHQGDKSSFFTMSKIETLGIRSLKIVHVREDWIWTHEWHAFQSGVYCPHASEMINCEVRPEDLIPYLNDMPNLLSLKITCDEVEGFEKIARGVRRTLQTGSEVNVPEIGLIETKTDGKQIDLQYEDLRRAWNVFRPPPFPNVDPSYEFRDLEDLIPRIANIQHTAQQGRMPYHLFLFFPQSADGIRRLQLRNHPGGARRLLDFTIALAQELSKTTSRANIVNPDRRMDCSGPSDSRWNFAEGFF